METKKTIRIGLLGAGVVGSGVLAVLKENQELINMRSPFPIKLVSVCDRQIEQVRPLVPAGVHLTAHADELVNHPDIDVVIETMGGIEPARSLIMQAISMGKHIVTANKALLATHGYSIFQAAQEKGVMVMFEASVAGSIPIIKTLREGLAANQIQWIAGIINGTANYVLSQMTQEKKSFVDALREAQKLGYAEQNPSLDIDGSDTAHKLAILASLAYGVSVDFGQVYREGIDRVDPKDLEYASLLGYHVKLLGITRKTTAGLELRVHPTLIPKHNLLASVNGVMNGLLISSNAAGISMFYGQGAGGVATASAILADVMEVARLHQADARERVPFLGSQPAHVKPLAFVSMHDVVCDYYLRLSVMDQPAVLAGIAQVLASHQISIGSVIQPENTDADNLADIVIITHATTENRMISALVELQRLPFVIAPVKFLRKEMLT